MFGLHVVHDVLERPFVLDVHTVADIFLAFPVVDHGDDQLLLLHRWATKFKRHECSSESAQTPQRHEYGSTKLSVERRTA